MKVIIIFALILNLYAEKIKDIANVVGIRDNQLIGYGLVVGLKGTGDGSSSKFTLRSLSNLLQTVNVKIDPKDIKSKNIAAVVVTATLPPFARSGDKLDVTISSIGDAKSLEGGTLLMTALKGVDGNIYAIAQGPISIGGRNANGSSVANHTTSAKIFEGAIVENEVSYDIYNKQNAILSLKRSNFKTAVAIQNKLNSMFEFSVAKALDPRTIKLSKPDNLSMVEFLSKVLDTNVLYEKEEKIVIDEGTGTIVAGINIEVDPVVITHEDITIKIQPSSYRPKNAKDIGDNVAIGLKNNVIYMKKSKVTIANITRSLQKLGASPKDIISILEAIKAAGAIRAKLQII